MPEENRGWTEWSQYVLKEIERLNISIIMLTKDLNEQKVDVGKLQVKASIWGGVTGLVTTLIALAMYMIKRG